MSNIIVMAFSPLNSVGCLLKKGLQRGGGHGHPRTLPLLRPCLLSGSFQLAQGCQSYVVGVEQCCALSKRYGF